MTFHPKSWLVWTASAVTVVTLLGDPVSTVVAAAALSVVGVSFIARGTDARAARLLLKVGLIFLVVRVVLFAITGHTGATTLFTAPRIASPWWLGSFSVGGRVTAEVVAQSAEEGAKVAALLVCAGVFLSIVPSDRVLRLLPRFLFEAGLVVAIALAFIPSLIRRAAEVRDAQRLRGSRARGARALRPLVVPVVADALERSISLAASMECRGYGRARGLVGRRAQVVLLLGLVSLSAGGAFVLFGRPAGAPFAIAGLLGIVGALRAMGGSVTRTRLRDDRLDAWDLAFLLSSALSAAFAIVARALPEAQWYPYPVLRAPVIDPRLVAIAASIAMPSLLASLRSLRLARASAQNATLEAAR
ncbi:MAG: energy-coupling factor transporter transmembrane component T [Actinomycetota bacterium]